MNAHVSRYYFFMMWLAKYNNRPMAQLTYYSLWEEEKTGGSQISKGLNRNG
jgi:hypothetical protein